MADPDRVYQFKITLGGIQPPIWRRIQVPDSYNFWDLHVAIQDAMGWQDSHLHLFRIASPRNGMMEMFGIPDDDGFEGDPVTLPGWEYSMAPSFPKVGTSAVYEYDFGDDWQHEVVLEEVAARLPRKKYPACVAGARACPPEDCGGIPGYEEMLQIIQNPAHEEHESMLEWLGGGYNPDAFDPEKVRFDDPHKRWKVAFSDT